MEAITGRNTRGLAIGPCRTFWLLPRLSNYNPIRFLAGNDDGRRCVRDRGRVYVTLGKASRRRCPDGRSRCALGAPDDLCGGVDDVSCSARARLCAQQLPVLFACVAVVQLLIVYAIKTTTPTDESADAGVSSPSVSELAPEPAPASFPSALLSKLPAAIGNDVIALETEDHYLRVHTVQGTALILMRMADAVALLDPQLGAQVHRRWWVAQAAVARVQMEGQKLSLCLINNALVPVGRTFSAAVKTRFANAPKISASG